MFGRLEAVGIGKRGPRMALSIGVGFSLLSDRRHAGPTSTFRTDRRRFIAPFKEPASRRASVGFLRGADTRTRFPSQAAERQTQIVGCRINGTGTALRRGLWRGESPRSRSTVKTRCSDLRNPSTYPERTNTASPTRRLSNHWKSSRFRLAIT